MDLNEIRQFIETEGGKFIIVENGRPVMVITSFEDYKKKKLSPEKKTKKPVLAESEEEDLKIEDLPF
ncbi:hypothetical protein ES703_48556 [subsurface metagenome]